MEQRYIQAHRLVLEVAEIEAIPDSVIKALRWRQWKVKTHLWTKQQSFSPRHLQLAQSSARLVEQNHGAINLIASKS
jgi:hypothetical protein